MPMGLEVHLIKCQTSSLLRVVECGSLCEIEIVVDLMVQLKERFETLFSNND